MSIREYLYGKELGEMDEPVPPREDERITLTQTVGWFRLTLLTLDARRFLRVESEAEMRARHEYISTYLQLPPA